MSPNAILSPVQDANSQQATQDLRESIQLDDTVALPVLDDETVENTIIETKEDEKTMDDKVEDTVEEKKAEEEKNTNAMPENEVTIRSTDNNLRDRPKSVLKNKNPTPVITTTTPNNITSNPHRDRECCNIS